MFLSYVENPNTNQISLKNLLDAIEPITPLSQTMKKKIDVCATGLLHVSKISGNIKNNEQAGFADRKREMNELKTNRINKA